jgi:hypothetical protein
MKSNLQTFMFGCLGVIVGFLLCRLWFVPAVSEQSAPAVLSVPFSSPSVITTQSQECMIVNPTFPPQVIGTWDPLKVAEEEYARTNK